MPQSRLNFVLIAHTIQLKKIVNPQKHLYLLTITEIMQDWNNRMFIFESAMPITIPTSHKT